MIKLEKLFKDNILKNESIFKVKGGCTQTGKNSTNSNVEHDRDSSSGDSDIPLEDS